MFLQDGVKATWVAHQQEAVEQLFNRKYAHYLQSEERFVLESSFNEHQVQVRITLQDSAGEYLYPVEAIVLRSGEDSSLDAEGAPEALVHALMDMQDAYWKSFLSGGRDTYVTLDWSEHLFEGQNIYMRGFERNPKLIAEADRLLREAGHGGHSITEISEET